MTLDEFNALTLTAATEQLRLCCAAERWIDCVCRGRPYTDTESLLQRAQQHWQALGETDTLQAFAGHPKIGDVGSLRKRYAASEALVTREQAGMNTASGRIIQALSEGNLAYEQKFGFIFIVCASGKSAAQMLELLQTRLGNTRASELNIAAAEQMKITELRLLNMLL
ncbi:MAG TPA: 2-oxo-4-hydroxy-4-carboxy-5-ureidoimidazoline decarboxylase [Gammaproteobacteria bacterium]|nr:2-oxo-4-hydroxy-4-carboxy-5-ureidoimidazoline decarboxylase [Gammaproteobacteria bacterium]